jgi:signal peptidase I
MKRSMAKRGSAGGGSKAPSMTGAEATRAADDAAEGPEETRWERIKANTKTIGSAVLLAMIIRIVLLEAFEIEGPSMEPTLLNGDRVVVSKFLYGLFLPFTNDALLTWGTPKVGDVVIVRSPADNIDIVKRVVGVAGDILEMRSGVLYRSFVAISANARTRWIGGPTT